MSDLDYDALRKVAEAATPGPWRVGANNLNHITTFDPPTVLRLLDLAQRAEADRAAVERVKRLAWKWESDDEESLNTFGQHLMGGSVLTCAEQLRAALDRKEDQ